jgi:hypothetical protein
VDFVYVFPASSRTMVSTRRHPFRRRRAASDCKERTESARRIARQNESHRAVAKIADAVEKRVHRTGTGTTRPQPGLLDQPIQPRHRRDSVTPHPIQIAQLRGGRHP